MSFGNRRETAAFQFGSNDPSKNNSRSNNVSKDSSKEFRQESLKHTLISGDLAVVRESQEDRSSIMISQDNSVSKLDSGD